ncbi:MAG TPA: hypothetical protein VK660_03985, partial [Xanthomonadaceae bacterium]|nr:hypothetical protein [Xanthomonadaceae bacterium]
GDCKDKARLLVTILARMGIAAEPALVSSRGGRWVEDHPPSAATFNHVIVRVHLGGRTIWLDPTRSGQRGTLDDHAVDDFGSALPIGKGIDALTRVAQTSGALARWRVDEHYKLGADGKQAGLQVTTAVAGTAAEAMRNHIASTDRDKLQGDYRDYYGKRFKDVRVAAPIQVTDDPATNRVVVVETYEIGNPLNDVQGEIRGLDTEANVIEHFIKLPEAPGNRYPVTLEDPVDVEQRIELDLPPGWKWDGESMHQSVEVPELSYALTAGQKDSEISFVHSYRSKAPFVAGDNVGRLIAGEQQINDLINRRFLVSMTDPSLSRDDRMARLVKGIIDGNSSGDAAKPVDGKDK